MSRAASRGQESLSLLPILAARRMSFGPSEQFAVESGNPAVSNTRSANLTLAAIWFSGTGRSSSWLRSIGKWAIVRDSASRMGGFRGRTLGGTGLGPRAVHSDPQSPLKVGGPGKGVRSHPRRCLKNDLARRHSRGGLDGSRRDPPPALPNDPHQNPKAKCHRRPADYGVPVCSRKSR